MSEEKMNKVFSLKKLIVILGKIDSAVIKGIICARNWIKFNWFKFAELLILLVTAIVINHTALETRRSADFASASAASASKSVDIMLMETRPYLHISCASTQADCKKQTSLTIQQNVDNNCLDFIKFDINNDGKLPAKITSAYYNLKFHRADGSDIPLNASHDADAEQVFVFPAKPVTKTLDFKSAANKPICDINNIKEITFDSTINYTLPMADEDMGLSYQVKLNIRPDFEKHIIQPEIIYERLK